MVTTLRQHLADRRPRIMFYPSSFTQKTWPIQERVSLKPITKKFVRAWLSNMYTHREKAG